MEVKRMSRKPREKKHVRPLTVSRNRAGYVFILPFLIGFVLFVAIPIVQSIVYSFHDIKIVESGYALVPKGLYNYQYIMTIDTNYRSKLVGSFISTIRDSLIVIPFSFFSALILSKSFRGRTAARTIFFLPVIISTGILAAMDSNSVISMVMSRDTAASVGTSGTSQTALAFINDLFAGSLPSQITGFVAAATDNIYQIVEKSGIQIVIFLGGLNTISPSIYESSNIEGATAWVNFWKITFPMSGPFILLNVIYTIIDSFTNISNPLIKSIWGDLTGLQNFGIASAAAWLYFLMIFVILGLVFVLISRKVFYRE